MSNENSNSSHAHVTASFEKLQNAIAVTPPGAIRDSLIQAAKELAETLAAVLKENVAQKKELDSIESARAHVNVNGAVNVEKELSEVLEDPEFLELTEEEQRKIIVYVAQEKLIEENVRLTQTHSANSGWEYWYQLGVNGTRQAFTETIEQMSEEIEQMKEELSEKELSLHQTTRKLRKQERINKSSRNGF